jgi:hypothetical protein
VRSEIVGHAGVAGCLGSQFPLVSNAHKLMVPSNTFRDGPLSQAG